MTIAQSPWVALVTIIFGLIGSAGLGGMLKTWLDHKRGVRKDTDEVALGLVGKLETRVGKLEGDLERERAACAADLSAHRHRINNQRTMIYALLHLFDMPIARRKEAIVRIRTDIAAMELAEATEKAIIVSAPLRGDEAA